MVEELENSGGSLHNSELISDDRQDNDTEPKEYLPEAMRSSSPVLAVGSPRRATEVGKATNIVEWEKGDRENPHSWSFARKIYITMVINTLPLVVNIGSSIMSSASTAIGKEYSVGSEVTTLTTSLYLMGYATGPFLFGPISERLGRKVPLIIGLLGFASFCLPIALAQNLYTVMICRFFMGFFGSSSMAITAGAMSDIWNTLVGRGIGVDYFVLMAFIGPVIGPVLGAFVTKSHLGWRWTMWIMAIVAFTDLIFAFLLLPETYAPVLLAKKAARLRIQTRNWALHSRLEETTTDLKTLAKVYLVRPWILLGTEPIHLLITVYISFAYAVLFLFFESFPISFVEDRHWKPQIGALSFLGLLVGALIAFVLVAYYTLTVYAREVALTTTGVIVPERRLPPMMAGAVVFPIGFFWFAWTSDPTIPWPAQVISTALVGAGIYIVMIQGLKYLVDVYLLVANSAISANTAVRSLTAAGFPLFAIPMYHKLGVAWATSLLGFLSLVMVPIPVLFYVYGQKLRAMSRGALNTL
ncbi:uncharacterized protein Z520_03949 [Fonsecaea multimorphosa CBS 102226]|uniref:Major facilitator superfamily (MFS) profile domain-containing protein n=1 Tax=Fonsecaea multimorphosa CBS 102226 TaxID=1442371 RepID=A0A0D2KU32_9EURO|nr:uncharacterized protein Z520_03949 [Fonsecaea multimorphosa CBS 102226]KIY00264.1 hypothetical protein Z520_03949 [Fonsecaea multimorphosa CBS 102226]OAL27099.1 hypothetical protein AYO22_03730 [Fonsecaea multimorphosa]